jgi:ribosomal protein S11
MYLEEKHQYWINKKNKNMALITITATPNNSIPASISGAVNFFFSSDTNSFCYKDSTGSVVQVFKKSQYVPMQIVESGSFYKIGPTAEYIIWRFCTPIMTANNTTPIIVFSGSTPSGILILKMEGTITDTALNVTTSMDSGLCVFQHATGDIVTDPSINGNLINITFEFAII